MLTMYCYVLHRYLKVPLSCSHLLTLHLPLLPQPNPLSLCSSLTLMIVLVYVPMELNCLYMYMYLCCVPVSYLLQVD